MHERRTQARSLYRSATKTSRNRRQQHDVVTTCTDSFSRPRREAWAERRTVNRAGARQPQPWQHRFAAAACGLAAAVAAAAFFFLGGMARRRARCPHRLRAGNAEYSAFNLMPYPECPLLFVVCALRLLQLLPRQNLPAHSDVEAARHGAGEHVVTADCDVIELWDAESPRCPVRVLLPGLRGLTACAADHQLVRSVGVSKEHVCETGV